MIVSDAPNCGVTYDRHNDDHNSFITQATDSLLEPQSPLLQETAQTFTDNAIIYVSSNRKHLGNLQFS
jgi:hypothetical protein